MITKPDKNKARLKRHVRVRAKISGTPECPRLDVFRSAKHIYAQIIDDVNGVTLCAASSMDKDFEGFGGNKEAAKKVGSAIAKKAADKGITEVVFDRAQSHHHSARDHRRVRLGQGPDETGSARYRRYRGRPGACGARGCGHPGHPYQVPAFQQPLQRGFRDDPGAVRPA